MTTTNATRFQRRPVYNPNKGERKVMARVRSKEFTIQDAMKALAITDHNNFYRLYFHCTQADLSA